MFNYLVYKHDFIQHLDKIIIKRFMKHKRLNQILSEKLFQANITPRLAQEVLFSIPLHLLNGNYKTEQIITDIMNHMRKNTPLYYARISNSRNSNLLNIQIKEERN
ncbi:hypothetical protein [Alkalihalobacillus trypoxylicola]|uniref:Uncharacterized protein n=1 Tax=Alkalihalobacillus trypoxylicola TaxID=519424 RepID=A0A162DE62_9BACI|nr:hypothetical protein [Alkalihalobacillus trypoxylicola]KYG29345.1 hypothetical protein AZF04_07415 [Alkalihalobacillus trypoxylicola]